jgi:hypothetical protein
MESQDEILGELNFIRMSILLKPAHADYLKKIDVNNASNAVRILIDTFMKQKRMLSFEKYLSSFAFGLALVGIGSILTNIYISLASMGTGLFCILFSLYMYGKTRIRYEKGE